jgi:hypothetical protein
MNTKVYEDDIKTHLEIADPSVPELDCMFRETLVDTLTDVHGLIGEIKISLTDLHKKLDKTTSKPKAKKETKTIVKKAVKPLVLKSEKKPAKPKGKKEKAAK